MLLSAHVFVGAAVGIGSGSPLVAGIAGLVSHHLMDMIPHWDPGTFYFPYKEHGLNRRDYTIAAIDVLAAALIGWALYMYARYANLQPLVLWGMVGSVLPDLWHHLPLWKQAARGWPITRVWYRFHSVFHATINPKYWWFGVVTQVVVGLIGWLVVRDAVEHVRLLIGSLPST